MRKGYSLVVPFVVKNVLLDTIDYNNIDNTTVYRVLTILNTIAPYFIEYAKEKKCPFCGKYFKVRSGLLNHVLITHKYEFNALANDIIEIINNVNALLKKHRFRLRKFDVYDRIEFAVRQIACKPDTPLYLPYTFK